MRNFPFAHKLKDPTAASSFSLPFLFTVQGFLFLRPKPWSTDLALPVFSLQRPHHRLFRFLPVRKPTFTCMGLPLVLFITPLSFVRVCCSIHCSATGPARPVMPSQRSTPARRCSWVPPRQKALHYPPQPLHLLVLTTHSLSFQPSASCGLQLSFCKFSGSSTFFSSSIERRNALVAGQGNAA